MCNNIFVTSNSSSKKLPVSVEIECSLREKFEGLQCPPPPEPQLSGTIGTKITLTSNTVEGHNFLVHGIRRVTIFMLM